MLGQVRAIRFNNALPSYLSMPRQYHGDAEMGINRVVQFQFKSDTGDEAVKEARLLILHSQQLSSC